MFNSNVSPLAGLLGIGYFLHTVSIPIIKNNAVQANNERDVLAGYLLVAGSYIIVGVMGYIGFTGYFFTHKFLDMPADAREITQNCIMMFDTTNVLAFFMRIALFCLLFCCFPLINHFLRSLVILLLFKDKEITDRVFRVVTISILVLPLLITIFYPKVGSILGLVGSIAGLIIVYVLPVITYLKKVKTECENPVLAKAIDQNLYKMK
jgi:sodium-coupled neutral amino acid transporter 9